MKKSQRFLRGTVFSLAVLLVLLVGINRWVAPDARTTAPSRTSPTELAALRDFSVIRIQGDFAVTIEQGAEFGISYTPISERRGLFNARQRGNELQLEGYGNRTETDAAQVRITLPALQSLQVDDCKALDLIGLAMPGRAILTSVEIVRLERIDAALSLRALAVNEIVLDAISARNSEITVASGGTRIAQREDPIP